jgi:hypothetical protein
MATEFGPSDPFIHKLTYQISNMSKPKIDLSYKQLISFMYGDFNTFTKRFMIYIVYLGNLFNKYSCVKGEATRLKWINAMQPQYERIEKTLTYFLITVSRLKRIADAIRESDDVYFAYKNYNQECLKIYKAIDVALLCKLMTQSEKDLCCQNIKYSRVFLQRCLLLSDINISTDNIEILKIGYLSSQLISELEHKHREEVKKAYDTLMFYDIPMNLELVLCCLNNYIMQLHELIKKDYTNVKYKYIACVFIKIYIYIHNRMIKPGIDKNNLNILENIICYAMDDLCIDDDTMDIHKHYDNLFRILDNRTIIQEDLYMQYYCGDMTYEEYHKSVEALMKVALRYY